LGDFGLHGGDVAGMGCAQYWSGFPHSGAHFSEPQYFVKKWGDVGKCNVVTYETPYNIYVEGDYKRCVCDVWEDGEAICQFEYHGIDHNDGDQSEDEKVEPDEDEDGDQDESD